MRFTFLLLIIFCSVNLLHSQTATPPSSGDGSVNNPYEISTLNNLYWIAVETNNGNSFEDKYFIQTENIDASATSDWFGGQGWVAIGRAYTSGWQTFEYPFSGNYDGDGKKISNLYINRTTNSVGLFGRTSGCSISNLIIEDADIKGSNTVGILAGLTWNCEISKVSVSGTVSGDEYYIGGLIGNNTAVVEKCKSSADVFGGSFVGGLVGWNYTSTSEVKKSYCTGDVEGTDYVGGFVGHNNGYVSDSYARGDVTLLTSASSNNIIAAFAGTSNISNSINNSYCTGNVFYENEDIDDTDNGFISSALWDSENNFFDSEISNQSSGIGALAENTDDMQAPQLYLEALWDLKGAGSDGVWNIGNERNNGYPYFVWEFPDDEAHPDANDPFILTNETSNVSSGELTLNARIVRIGYPSASQHGFCWNTSGNPTINDSKTELGTVSEPNEFENTINMEDNGLEANTIYFAKAYATNTSGTFYGEEILFTLSPQGDGLEANPYIIESLANLFWMATEVNRGNNFNGSYFRQNNDIDASPVSLWNNGAGWEPIGINSDNSFNGTYNGNENIISNLYINRPSEDYTGLFGYIQDAEIDYLGLENCDITGNNYSGSITGYNSGGTIEYCFSTGNIGGNEYLGGLAGYCSGLINNSYSTCEADGTDYVAGFAGQNTGTIKNCYSMGSISGNNAGGFVSVNSGTVNNSFWDTETSGQANSAGGTGKNTQEMTTLVTFIESGWLFKGVEEDDYIWNKDNDRNNDYPYLDWQYPDDPASPEIETAIWAPYLITENISDVSSDAVTFNSDISVKGNPAASQHGFCWNTTGAPTVDDDKTELGEVSETGLFTAEITGLIPVTKYYVRAFATNTKETVYGNEIIFVTNPPGSGTESDPYQIYSLLALEWMSDKVQNGNSFTNTYFRQTNDIDASDSENSVWTPIGQIDNIWEDDDENTGFNGFYDGRGYSVNNLHINLDGNWEASAYGLFGMVGPDAVIENTEVSDIDIQNGARMTGGIAGYNKGTILNCISSGSIQGWEHYIGGIAGINYGIIDKCHSSCEIDGQMDFGGIAGAASGTISNSYFTGSVVASSSWHMRGGGLVGWIMNDESVVENCYTNAIVENVSFAQGDNIGPFYGANYDGTISDSYWNISVYEFDEDPPENHEYMDGARTTQEMTYPYGGNTYSEWDFDNIWSADEDYENNNGYPYIEKYVAPDKYVNITLSYKSLSKNGNHENIPVLVELRNGETLMSSNVIAELPGIVSNDGEVKVNFVDVEDGNYWILVRAGGFMPVCTPDKQYLTNEGINYDFTTSSDKSVLGESGMYNYNEMWHIRPGDFNGDGSIGAFDVNDLIPHIGVAVNSEIPQAKNEAIGEIAEESGKLISIKAIYHSYYKNNSHKKLPVMIELLSGEVLMESELVARKPGIIDENGNVEISFGDIDDGDYWILLRATTFMPVCTPDKQSLSVEGINYDFTTSSDKSVLGESAMYNDNDEWHIRPGDLNGDGSIGAFDVNALIPNIGVAVNSEIPKE